MKPALHILKGEMKMNKPASEKISRLMKNKYLIKYIIILFALSISNNAIAGSPSTTGSVKVPQAGLLQHIRELFRENGTEKFRSFMQADHSLSIFPPMAL